MTGDIMHAEDVANELRIPEYKTLRILRSGELPSFGKIGKHWKISRSLHFMPYLEKKAAEQKVKIESKKNKKR